MELRNTLKTQHGDIKLVSHVHVLVSECIKSLKQSNISMQAHEYAFSKKKLPAISTTHKREMSGSEIFYPV